MLDPLPGTTQGPVRLSAPSTLGLHPHPRFSPGTTGLPADLLAGSSAHRVASTLLCCLRGRVGWRVPGRGTSLQPPPGPPPAQTPVVHAEHRPSTPGGVKRAHPPSTQRTRARASAEAPPGALSSPYTAPPPPPSGGDTSPFFPLRCPRTESPHPVLSHCHVFAEKGTVFAKQGHGDNMCYFYWVFKI